MVNLKKNPGKCLLAYLRATGLDHFGSIIPVEDIFRVLGVEYPEFGSRAIYNALALIELKAVGYVRDRLANEGRHLHKCGDSYRIALPSENVEYAQSYERAGSRKLAYSLRLVVNTPVGDAVPGIHQLETRLKLKLAAVSDRSVHGAVARGAS